MVVLVVAAISNNTEMIQNQGKEKNIDTTASHGLHPRQETHPHHLPMSLRYATLIT